MEDPVAGDLQQHLIEQRPGELRPVHAVALEQRAGAAQRHAVQALEHEHAAGGELRVDRPGRAGSRVWRAAIARRLRASTRKSSSSRIAVAKPSASSVTFSPRRPLGSIVASAFVPRAVRASRTRASRRHDVQVALDLGLDARPLDLDHDLGAGAQPRAVDLRDRRGGQRHRLEVGEHGLRRRAQLLDEQPLDRRPRRRRDLVLQPVELLDELGGAAGPGAWRAAARA